MVLPETVKNVYLLCNPQKEPERYKRLIPHLLMHGIPRDKLKVASPTWGDTLSIESIFNVYNPYLNRGNIPKFKFGSLSKGEVSLNINFYNIILNSMKDLSGNDCIIIFESDVFLRRDFDERLSKIISDLSGVEWDYVSLGEGVGTRPDNCDNSYYSESKLYKPKDSWVFRGTDSMLLSRRFIENLHKTFLPFKECLEWELNFQILLHKGIGLWADPPLAEPGSSYNRSTTHTF
jgi:hypothetical protein